MKGATSDRRSRASTFPGEMAKAEVETSISDRTGIARICAALGIVAALVVPLLLLATWGHLYTHGFGSVIRAFHGGDLPGAVRLALFALSAGVVVVGLVAVARPLRYPGLLLVAGLAMAGEVGLIVLELNSTSLFGNDAYRFAAPTIVAGVVVGGVGAVIWFALFSASVRGQRCPDCAERVQQTAIECPYCGYEFPLSGHTKRCEACRRPVKAEARVCRFCHHRFGEPVED